MSKVELKSEAATLMKELLSLTATEERECEICERLNHICPDPAWSDYIYWSDDYICSNGDTDVDAVVEKVFSYKPIIL